MAYSVFQSSLAKYYHAASHVERLKSELENYLLQQPYEMQLVPSDGRSPNVNLVLEIKSSVPPLIGLIAGDAIRNLRSALDALAVDIIHLSGAETGDARFPFCEWRVDLPEAIGICGLDRASPAAIEALINLAPCRDGDEMLYSLQSLSEMEKTNVLLPSFDGWSSIDELTVVTAKGDRQIRTGIKQDPRQPLSFPADVAITAKGVRPKLLLPCSIPFPEGLELFGIKVAFAIQTMATLHDIPLPSGTYAQAATELSRH